MSASWELRLARMEDVDQLEELIPLSVRVLQAPYYTPQQMNAALGPVFGVDRQLLPMAPTIRGGGENGGGMRRLEQAAVIVRRRRRSPASTEELDPRVDAARVRAFFVHPEWARRGIGRAILTACEHAIRSAGFRRIEMIATLAGVPLYTASGYQVIEPFEMTLPGGIPINGMRMGKDVVDDGA